MVVTQAVAVRRRRAKQGTVAQWRMAVACGLAALSATAARGETLPDAITRAYESNPTLAAQRAQVKLADEAYVQARAGLRPQVNASSTASYSRTSVNAGRGTFVDTNGDGIPDTAVTGSGVTERNLGNASLSLSQPIYTGGRTTASITAAEAEILAAREALRETEGNLVLSVVQAYVDVRRDQRIVEIRRQDVQTLARRLEETQARFDVGELTGTDVAQAKARLGTSRAQLAAAEGQLDISAAAYAAVVGDDPGELAPRPDLDPLLPVTIAQAYDTAEQQSPRIGGAELVERGSRARIAFAKAQRRPTVSLRTGYGYSGQIDPFVADRLARNLSASVVTTLPLYSGGILSSQVEQAVQRNNIDRLRLETTERQVRQAVAQAWSQLRTARAAIAANEEVVKAARFALEGVRLEFELGLRTTLDVLNAEQELRTGELALVTSRRDAYVAGAALLNAQGRLEARALAPQLALYDPALSFRRRAAPGVWAPIDHLTQGLDRIAAPRGAAPLDLADPARGQANGTGTGIRRE
ncbi:MULTISPECIES: TolC family outer membrane protein [unclassified Phenylobacterium]|uniref:TolC family outer membrane protein n=1 Tax=unclassified Phenylobacterium TaxID=2640670 RepID=UPI0009E88836|nr:MULTISPECIES: TolC family outer membrane protein [unclassified Phenylobacterium]